MCIVNDVLVKQTLIKVCVIHEAHYRQSQYKVSLAYCIGPSLHDLMFMFNNMGTFIQQFGEISIYF